MNGLRGRENELKGSDVKGEEGIEVLEGVRVSGKWNRLKGDGRLEG